MKKIVKIAVLTFAAAMLLLLTTACSEALPSPEITVDEATIRAAILQEINEYREENDLEPLTENAEWSGYMNMFAELFEKGNTTKIVWNDVDWTAGYAKSYELRAGTKFSKEFGYEMYDINNENYDPEYNRSIAELTMEFADQDTLHRQVRSDDVLYAVRSADATMAGIAVAQVNGKIYWICATVGYWEN